MFRAEPLSFQELQSGYNMPKGLFVQDLEGVAALGLRGSLYLLLVFLGFRLGLERFSLPFTTESVAVSNRLDALGIRPRDLRDVTNSHPRLVA